MISERLYAALLYLYPRHFRLEYGDEMVETFRAAARDARKDPASFWLLIAEDVCHSACQAHLREVEPGLRHLARCTVAAVLATAVLVGSITVSAALWGGPPRAISQYLQVANMRTGWVAASFENGKNKLVPSITVTLKNISREPVGTVRLNAIFRRVGETKTWGGAYIPGVRSDGFPAESSTTPVVLRSPLGYTGTEPSRELFQKKEFVDVRVTLLAKRGSSQWQALGEWPVQRELLEQEWQRSR